MADGLEELRAADERIWKAISDLKTDIGVINGEMRHKADRDEMHKFKDAIFDRMETLVARVVQQQNEAAAEKFKIFGHQTADVLQTKLDPLRVRIDKLEAMVNAAQPKAEADERSGIDPKFTVWAAFGGLTFGLLLSEYAIPVVVSAARRLLFGV